MFPTRLAAAGSFILARKSPKGEPQAWLCSPPGLRQFERRLGAQARGLKAAIKEKNHSTTSGWQLHFGIQEAWAALLLSQHPFSCPVPWLRPRGE